MSWLSFAFDLFLGAGLLMLAWRAVTAPGLFASVIVFMAFGLVMAIAWARLGAPDLALAEAAISAGITGALLLNGCKAALTDGGDKEAATIAAPPPVRRWLAVPVCVGLGVSLAFVMIWVAADQPGAAPAMLDSVAAHALENPVTVVLLDLRGYDTLLEMVVLLASLLGVRVLLEQHPTTREWPAPAHSPRPMVDPLVAMATPVLLMTALYLFWIGSEAPGGAFQAGALLGALGVMYRLTGHFDPIERTPGVLRLGLVIGLLVFAVFACLGLVWREWPLSYPERATAGVVLLIEFSMMISIALTLTMLFAGAPGIRVVRGQGFRS